MNPDKHHDNQQNIVVGPRKKNRQQSHRHDAGHDKSKFNLAHNFSRR